MKDEPTLMQRLDTLRQISERSKSWWVHKTAAEAIEEIKRLESEIELKDDTLDYLEQNNMGGE